MVESSTIIDENKKTKIDLIELAVRDYYNDRLELEKKQKKEISLNLILRLIPLLFFGITVLSLSHVTEQFGMIISLISIISLGIISGFSWVPKSLFDRKK